MRKKYRIKSEAAFIDGLCFDIDLNDNQSITDRANQRVGEEFDFQIEAVEPEPVPVAAPVRLDGEDFRSWRWKFAAIALRELLVRQLITGHFNAGVLAEEAFVIADSMVQEGMEKVSL